MAQLGSTIEVMAKKKPPSAGNSGQGRSPAYTVYARVPPDLGAAFEAYLNSLKPKPKATAAVILALEMLLTSEGFWPPAKP